MGAEGGRGCFGVLAAMHLPWGCSSWGAAGWVRGGWLLTWGQLCWWCLVPLIRDTGTSLWGGAEGRSWLEASCPRCSGLQPFPEVCWGRGDTGVGVTPRSYLCKLILWQLACD